MKSRKSRTSTTMPVSRKLIRILCRLNEPVIVRHQGEDLGLLPSVMNYRLAVAAARGELRIRKSTYRTIMALWACHQAGI